MRFLEMAYCSLQADSYCCHRQFFCTSSTICFSAHLRRHSALLLLVMATIPIHVLVLVSILAPNALTGSTTLRKKKSKFTPVGLFWLTRHLACVDIIIPIYYHVLVASVHYAP